MLMLEHHASEIGLWALAPVMPDRVEIPSATPRHRGIDTIASRGSGEGDRKGACLPSNAPGATEDASVG